MNEIFHDILNIEVESVECIDSATSKSVVKHVSSRLGDKTCKILKKDLTISHCLAAFKDAIIIEIIIDAGKQGFDKSEEKFEQIYYFKIGERVSCMGESFWTTYHEFKDEVLRYVYELESCQIPMNEEALFVGSRDNFTHAFYDYASIELMAEDIGLPKSLPRYFGIPSKVQDIANNALGIPRNRTRNEGIETRLFNIRPDLRIRLSKYRVLHLFRHVSIYKVYDLIRGEINKANVAVGIQNDNKRHKNIALIRSSNDRIINQDTFIQEMRRRGVYTLEGVHLLNAGERKARLGRAEHLVVPPGSDNVNAFLFGEEKALVTQMISLPRRFSLLEKRLLYFSCIRYILPVLHRTGFWVADNSITHLSGEWYHPMVTRDIKVILENL